VPAYTALPLWKEFFSIFMKKTALITGANRGIGLEIARQLASLGWHVVLAPQNIDFHHCRTK
jgi:FlaA1/EpsC-like NDP-sugar epimerase